MGEAIEADRVEHEEDQHRRTKHRALHLSPEKGLADADQRRKAPRIGGVHPMQAGRAFAEMKREGRGRGDDVDLSIVPLRTRALDEGARQFGRPRMARRHMGEVEGDRAPPVRAGVEAMQDALGSQRRRRRMVRKGRTQIGWNDRAGGGRCRRFGRADHERMVGDPDPEPEPVEQKEARRKIVAQRVRCAIPQGPGEGRQDRTFHIEAAQVRARRVGDAGEGCPGSRFACRGSEARYGAEQHRIGVGDAPQLG